MLPLWVVVGLLLVTGVQGYQLSSSLASQPFLMPGGAQYRDQLTLQAARAVADFAKRLQHSLHLTPYKSPLRPEGVHRKATPTFPSASPTSSTVAGHPRQDEEIFDFTDSRFVSPPEENRANYPYVEESVVGPTLSPTVGPTVGATVEGVPSEAGFMGAAGLGK